MKLLTQLSFTSIEHYGITKTDIISVVFTSNRVCQKHIPIRKHESELGFNFIDNLERLYLYTLLNFQSISNRCSFLTRAT